MDSPTLVDFDWSSTPEGKRHISSSRSYNNETGVMSCGILERPLTLLNTSPSFREGTPKIMKYKVLVCSPIGNMGKTSCIAKLCGSNPPKRSLETPGLVGHLRYWPIKLKSSSEIIYFHLMFFEFGPSAEKNYPHIVQLALDGCEAFVVAFSLANRNSFDMLTSYISSMKDKFVNVCPADLSPDIVVVGTHADSVQQIEVSQQDVANLRGEHPVYRMKCVSSTVNVPPIALPTIEDESKKIPDAEVISFMNNLCNILLLRDKSALQI